jgi:putative methyltransferase (TIGR04325 family)
MRAFLKAITPPILTDLYRRLRYPAIPKAFKVVWKGNYPTWQQALQKSFGYDSPLILEKVKHAVIAVKAGKASYERDSMLFYKPEYNWPLIALIRQMAMKNRNELDVTDFGGALGSTWFQNRKFLKDLSKLNWSVVEQPHFVSCGNEFIRESGLEFFTNMEEALKNKRADVILLSTVLQYLEEPYKLLAKARASGFKYILIDRITFLREGPERITVQYVPPQIYEASYPAWFFEEKKFLEYFNGTYDLVCEFDPYPGIEIDLGDTKAYYKGFLFENATLRE